ncbi:MAG: radical SAM protein [Candidatus Omnitrophota bacterium]|nr:radical SAM protein [Candidatus Omnitrophota bacterium]MDZ4241941.1 radical SAM protein [Candidatus Omnitrophota bacterium]
MIRNPHTAKSILLIQSKVGRMDYAGLRLPDALLSIAALPLQNGYSVRLIDQRVEKDWKAAVREHINATDVLCAGITCMTGPQIRYALEINRFIKSLRRDLPVVWGGVHPSLFPEQTLQNENIDYVIKGEGERTFFEFVERLRSEEGMAGLPGLYYKENGAVVKNPPRGYIEDLDQLPNLPYELVDIEKYRASGLFKGPSLTFFTSRGCPFPCAFCYNRVFNEGQWRALSPQGAVDRLEYIVKTFGIRKFFIQDDNFIIHIKRFWELMGEMIRRDLGIEWACMGVRADTLHQIGEKGLEMMVRAGCRDIDIGIESGSPRILKLIKKDIDLGLVTDVNRMMAKFPIKSKCTFMIGFPGETDEEVRQTVNFAVRMGRENPNVFTLIFVYCPYPGTELFQAAVEAGFKIPERLEDWADFTPDEWYLNRPNWLTPQQRERYNNICFASLFSCKSGMSKISSPLLRSLFALYHPVAKFRLRNNFFRFPLETSLQKNFMSAGRKQLDDADAV